MQLNLKLSQKAFILIAVPLLFELVFVTTLYVLMKKAQDQSTKAEHSRMVIVKADQLGKKFYDAGVAFAAYKVTRNQLFGNRYQKLSSELPDDLKELRTMVITNKQQTAILDHVEAILQRTLELFDESKHSIDQTGAVYSLREISISRREAEYLLNQLISELNQFTNLEKAAQRSIPEEELRSRELVDQALLVGVAASIGLAITLAVLP